MRKAFNRSIVPLGRGYFLMIPGTSCLATIMLSLRDKNHPPTEAPRIIPSAYGLQPEEHRLEAYATLIFLTVDRFLKSIPEAIAVNPP
jgi:hypothetical protein